MFISHFLLNLRDVYVSRHGRADPTSTNHVALTTFPLGVYDDQWGNIDELEQENSGPVSHEGKE